MRRVVRRLVYLLEAALMVGGFDVPRPASPELIIKAVCASLLGEDDEIVLNRLRQLADYDVVLEHDALIDLFVDVMNVLASIIDQVDRMGSVDPS